MKGCNDGVVWGALMSVYKMSFSLLDASAFCPKKKNVLAVLLGVLPVITTNSLCHERQGANLGGICTDGQYLHSNQP